MTRKQRHLLTRIIVAAVLFLAGSLLHLPELAEMAVFLVCYVVVGWDIVWKAITNILHVTAVVIPIGIHQPAADVRDLLAEIFLLNTVLSGKHFRNRLNQIGAELPHIRVTGITAHPGIAHIENVVQTRNTAGLV